MSANVSNLEVVHHAFNALLTSLTPAQMSTFAQQLRAAATASSGVTTATSTPQPDQYALMTLASSSPVRRDKRAARAKAKEARAERNKLRPLNAFMAFRSYYSSQLPGLTQKTKSGLIRSLWEQDHWKHFWAIAAKAYSELRDNHMGQITLESFLKNVTGLLGVIPADQYLATMGWTLVDDSDGEVHLVKSVSVVEKQNVPLTSNLSVRDVVNHCYQIGLLVRPDRSFRRRNDGDIATMSFLAFPNAAKTSPTKTQPQSYHDNRQDTSEQEFGDLVQRALHTSLVGAREPVNASIRPDYNPSIGTVIAEQQGALEAYPSQYPYTLHFHPDIQQPVLGFNPGMIQDDFDPFDISDYVNLEM